MEQNYNNFPDIDIFESSVNPVISSSNCPYVLPFYQTRDTLIDVEVYRNFLKNAIQRFRHSRTYKNYKGFLMGLGLDKCQFHGNITAEMASIEMHHTIITIYDIAIIITEHLLNTHGMITTFDLAQAIRQEHIDHKIPLTMLSLTPHQLFHNNEDFYIHPDMAFGNWYEFLQKYHTGITQDIAFKILFYVKRAIDEEGSNDGGLLEIRDRLMDWSQSNVQLNYK